MLLSSTNLYYTLRKERYSKNPQQKDNRCVVVAFFLFIIEIVILFYAISIAVECTTTPTEKVIHIIVALFFTLPYLVGMMLLSPCAKGMIGLKNKMNFGSCGFKMGFGSCGM